MPTLHMLPKALHYLDTVARVGSIQAASRSLGIAASAINRQILALEGACEVPLFERKPRGMTLTEAGQSVVLLARRWRSDEERLVDEFRTMKGLERGNVRLSAMDSLSNSVLPACVHQLSQSNPGIHLSVDIVSPAQAGHDLQAGLSDLAMAFNLPADRTRHTLWSADLPFGCLIGPGHSLWKQETVLLKEVADFPIAAQSRELPVRQYLDRSHSWVFATSEPTMVTNSPQLLKQVLKSGQHLTITSQMDACDEIASGVLRFVPIIDEALKPQTLSIAVDQRRSLSYASRIVANILISLTDERLSNTYDRIKAVVGAFET